MWLNDVISIGSLPFILAGLLVAGFGIPIPEDVLLLAAGVVAHRTMYSSWVVLPLCYVSAIGADCGLFLIARRFGEPLLRRVPFRWLVTGKARRRVEALFTHYGAQAVFVGRHLSGARGVVFMLAGIERMPFARFLLWDGLAGLVTIPVVFALGYLFSAHVEAVQAGLARAEHWIAVTAAALLLVGWVFWSHRGGPRGQASR